MYCQFDASSLLLFSEDEHGFAHSRCRARSDDGSPVSTTFLRIHFRDMRCRDDRQTSILAECIEVPHDPTRLAVVVAFLLSDVQSLDEDDF